jgi:hypothetical protein
MAAKREMERRISELINAEIVTFHDATGVGLSDIRIELIDITTLGQTFPVYVVGGVSVTLALE